MDYYTREGGIFEMTYNTRIMKLRFDIVWDTYVECPTSKLNPDALRLKKKMIKFVEGIVE